MTGVKDLGAEPAQAEVVTFLRDWTGQRPGGHFTTHGAHVFIAGGEALKIKRAVRYPYLDFSTLELRRRACEREIEVNRANARHIYLGTVAITREADGHLAIGGAGAPVEWAVRMRAFDQADLLGARADAGELDPATLKALADAAFAAHARAAVALGADSAGRLGAVIDQLIAGFAKHGSIFAEPERQAFADRVRAAFGRARPCLQKRAAAGCVRRVHGDLHLGNVVLWQGMPVLFDAIEFDEDLATIDTLYDLAFLLMDLVHRGRRSSANALLNRYLWRSNRDLDIEALIAMPLFLGLRAGVRALVSADKLQLAGSETDRGQRERAGAYLHAALAFLEPPPARIVAVGGLSGTGKSTLAAALAPGLGPAPGAVHLRSDLERKSMFGVEETVRLGAEAYTATANTGVYEVLGRKARLAVAAGHAAIVDAVFARADERAAIESVAAGLGVPFQGLWLSAPRNALLARVLARTNDASDATASVVEQQLAWQDEPVAWPTIDAGGPAVAAQASARRAVGL